MRRFVGLATVLALVACGRDKGDTTTAVQTALVDRQDIVVDVEATGVIQPINAVEVRSKASGQIIKMPVELGSQVKPGDLLVQIDPRDVQSRYDQALAALQAAQANLKVASAQQKRSDELFQQGVITAPERETATLAYANGQSQLATARTNLEIAKVNLEDATVRAPIAGTVIQKNVSLGQVISSSTASFGGGTILLQMANLGAVMDSALVNESDIGHVRPGQTATVTVDAYPNRAFHGTVRKIAPQATVQQSVTMFPVLIELDNEQGLLMPGMNSDVSVLVERRDNVLAVPNDAVRSPRDAMAAAAALGLDPDQVREALREQLGGRGGRRRGGRPGVDTTTSAGELVAASFQQGGAARGRRSRAGQAGPGDPPRGRDSTLAIDSSEAPPVGSTRPHPGLVFLARNGTFIPKVVMLGVGNYDVTQVISGLQQGDRVALINAAMLQQARDRMLQRIRSRSALPGMQSSDKDSGKQQNRRRQ